MYIKQKQRLWVILNTILALSVGVLIPYVSMDLEKIAVDLSYSNFGKIVGIALFISGGLWLIVTISDFVRSKEMDWFKPVAFFGFYYLLSAFGQPVVNFLLKPENSQLRMYVPLIPVYLLLSTLGLIGFLVGVFVTNYQFQSGRHTKGIQHRHRLRLTPNHLKRLQQFSTTVMALAVLALIFALSGTLGGVLSGEAQYGAGQFGSTFSYYVLVLAGLLFPPALSLSCYASALQRGRILTWPVGVLVGLYVIVNGLSGDRGLVFTAILVLVLSQHYLIRRFRLVHMLVGSLSAIVFSSIIISWRSSNWSLSGVLATFDRTRFMGEWTEFVWQLGSPAIIVTHLMKWFPGHVSFYYGQTYFDAVLSLVPSFFFGGKLARPFISPTFVYKRLFEGGGFNLDVGYGFSLVAEAYMNFGWFGPLLIMFIIGFALQRLYLLASRSDNWLAWPRYIVVLSLLPYALRTDAISLVKSLVYGLLLLVVASWWALKLTSPDTQTPRRIVRSQTTYKPMTDSESQCLTVPHSAHE